MDTIELFRKLGSISRKATTTVNQQVKSYQLENNLFIYFLRIMEHEGITQQELATLTSIDKTTISRALQKLEKNQLIEKRADPNNRKINRLYGTEKGRAIFNDVYQIEKNYVEHALKNLTSIEQLNLYQLLKKIN